MNRIEYLKQRVAELDRKLDHRSWTHKEIYERRELNSELTRLETERFNKEIR